MPNYIDEVRRELAGRSQYRPPTGFFGTGLRRPPARGLDTSLRRNQPMSEAEARTVGPESLQKQWEYFLPYMQERPEQYAAARAMQDWGTPVGGRPRLQRSELATYQLPSGGFATIPATSHPEAQMPEFRGYFNPAGGYRPPYGSFGSAGGGRRRDAASY